MLSRLMHAMRRPGARTLFLCATLSTLGLSLFATESGASAAQPPAGPDDNNYATLVSQYRRGDAQGAIAALVRWPLDRVRAVTRVAPSPQGLDVPRTEAAVMLHSDVSMLMAAIDEQLSRQHIDVARGLVRVLPDDTAARFKERWQAYAVGPSLIQHDLRAARLTVRQGIAAFPRSADLQFMEGTLLELSARSETSDLRGVWVTRATSDRDYMDTRTATRISSGLTAAGASYLRALDLDPSLLSARLRLGWVYGVNNSAGHAREQVRMVTDSATSRDLRYLTHLILGGFAEQEGRLDLAYEEYDRAHSVQASAQTAHLALMRAARMTGRAERAQQLFAEYATRASGTEDPWWYFSTGLDPELSTWLHAQVTQR